MRIFKFFILILIFFHSALSHDLWIEKDNDKFVLYYGHFKPQNNEEKFIKYGLENILEVHCFDTKGNPIKIKIDNNYPLKIENSCKALYILTSSGFWTKTPYGLKNIPKNKTDLAIESWQSFESVKRVEENYDKPLTNHLEITLLNNLKDLKVGDKVTFLVTYNKKPISDVVVTYFEKPIGTTDEEGKINIRIKEKGLQIIGTSYTLKGDGKKADKIIFTSFLNFEVKK